VEEPSVAGRLGAAYGVRGWVHFASYLEPPESLFDVASLWSRRSGPWQPLDLVEAKAHGKGFVVRVGGVADRTQAEHLRGTEVGVLRGDLPASEPDEFYWEDLLGLMVVNLEGDELGKVRAFMETGANDVMVLSGDRERMVPFAFDPVAVDSVVRSVDLEEGVIRVDWHLDD
jgi:16S rRNA processing protein RimM